MVLKPEERWLKKPPQRGYRLAAPEPRTGAGINFCVYELDILCVFCITLTLFIRQVQSLCWILSKSKLLTNSADSTEEPPEYVPPVFLSVLNWWRVFCMLSNQILALAAWVLAFLLGFVYCWQFTVRRAGCFTSQGSHAASDRAGEFAGSETMEMPLALGLGLKSVYGVRFLRFFLDLQITSPPDTVWLLWSHRSVPPRIPHVIPRRVQPPSVPCIFLVPPACFGCSCWHFQLFLGLFFNYVTFK